MNLEKFTVKSQEALTIAHQVAIELNHQELGPMHVLLALMRQQKGFVGTLLDTMGVSRQSADDALMEKLHTIPAVTGPGANQTYMSRSLTAVLGEAEKIASRMKDDFVSVEHIFLAALRKRP